MSDDFRGAGLAAASGVHVGYNKSYKAMLFVLSSFITY